jgi:kynurenine formamidase
MIGIRRIVDLSVVVDRTTQVYPGDPVPELRPATRIETEGFNVLSLSIGSHTGTHVDAPFHVEPGGDSLERLDLGLFAGRAVIVDVTGHAPSQPIVWDDVAAEAERLTPDSILVLRTGWSERHWRTDLYLEHPFLDPGACAHLVDLGMRTLAIDALNPDPTAPETGLPVHHLVLGAGGVIAENLTNLSAVEDPDAIICLFPIRLGADADGAPCRAVALELSAP